MSKRDIVSKLLGPEANKHLAREVKDKALGVVQQPARHLGGQYSYNQSNHKELRIRLTAMKKGRTNLGQFWHSAALWVLKSARSIMQILKARLSSLGSYMLRDSELRRIDSQLVKLLRCLVRGEFCDKPELRRDGYHRRPANRKVFRTWRALPTKGELAVTGVRWQQMVANRKNHSQLVAAV